MRMLPFHMRGRREKLFGDGRPIPLDRNAKVRIMLRARVLMRRTAPGKHYGAVTAKAMAVLQALLWGFHNARSGRCFPSYAAIAARADCARSTVAVAIRALEQAGILTWVNRIVRVREADSDLFGRIAWRWRVLRTSNGYQLIDPQPSKSDFPLGTPIQIASKKAIEPKSELAAALERLGRAVGEAPT
jgi:hypothetical protein